MHGTRYLPVYRTGTNLLSVPDLLRVLRRSLGKYLMPERFTILQQTCLCNFMGDIIDISPLCRNTELLSQTQQLLRIFYMVISIR